MRAGHYSSTWREPGADSGPHAGPGSTTVPVHASVMEPAQEARTRPLTSSPRRVTGGESGERSPGPTGRTKGRGTVANSVSERDATE